MDRTRIDNYDYECYNYYNYYGTIIIIKEPLISTSQLHEQEIRFKHIQIHGAGDVDIK